VSPAGFEPAQRAGGLILSETFPVKAATANAEPVSEHVDVDAKLLGDVAVGLGVDAGDVEQLKDLAAVAMTRIAWRDGPVEDWHSRPEAAIADGEMMRSNAATTRAVRQVMDRTPMLSVMFDHVGRVLVDPYRRLPDGRTLVALAPSALDLARYQAHVAACCARWASTAVEVGEMTVLTLLAVYGARYCWRWWRSTGWPRLVEEFIRRLVDPQRWGSARELVTRRRLGDLPGGATSEELRQLLLAGPDRLDIATAEFCLRAGLSGLLPQHCGLPPVRRHPLPAGYLDLVEPDET
jgi:hypothetical protein